MSFGESLVKAGFTFTSNEREVTCFADVKGNVVGGGVTGSNDSAFEGNDGSYDSGG